MSCFETDAFDAVPCIGELYHLMDRPGREKRVAECLRILKTSGTFVFAYINRNAVYINHFLNNLSNSVNSSAILKTGVNSVFYTVDFGEPVELVNGFPLEKLHLFGQESLLAPCEHNIISQSKEVYERWLHLAEALCERDEFLSWSEHLMYVGRKRQ